MRQEGQVIGQVVNALPELLKMNNLPVLLEGGQDHHGSECQWVARLLTGCQRRHASIMLTIKVPQTKDLALFCTIKVQGGGTFAPWRDPAQGLKPPRPPSPPWAIVSTGR